MPSPRNQAFGSQLRQNNYLPLPNQGFQPLGAAMFAPAPSQFIPQFVNSSPYGSYVTPPPPNPPVFNNLRINPHPEPPQQSQQQLNPLQYPHYGFSVKNETSQISPGVLFVQNKYTQPPKQMKIVSRLPIRRLTPCDSLQCSFDRSFCHYTQANVSSRGLR